MLTLLFCSHFSPLYEFNFSPDPSIYLTMGRGIMNGLVPYKDLLDIKGPIIFFLYALFSPIKLGTNYFGIFILETIALWISITFLYKTIILISKSTTWAFLLTLIYPFILLNRFSFMDGGEAEEFILPFIFILIYLTIKIINNNYQATKFQYLFLGFSFGFVFWIKYTCIGAWLAFYLCVCIILLSHKNYTELKSLFIYNSIGFLIPTIFILGYFIINNALYDFIWGYFGWNFIYGSSTSKGIINYISFIIFHSLFPFLKQNPFIWILVTVGPYFVILKSKLLRKTSTKLVLLLMVFTNMALETIGGTMYSYYQLIAIPFITFFMGWIAIKLKKVKFKLGILTPIISIFSILLVLLVNPSIKESKLTNYNIYQQQFTKIITKNGTTSSVLDFNELDRGWYNYLNILPPTKYFNKMNSHKKEYKTLTNAQLKLVKEKKVEYIICPVTNWKFDIKLNKTVFKNYHVIAQKKFSNTYKLILLEKNSY